MRDAAGERTGMADRHGDRFGGGRWRRGGGGCGGLGCCCLLGFFLAAAVDADKRCCDERQADRAANAGGRMHRSILREWEVRKKRIT